ncbi:MAG: glycosyltransferase family 2 protein [Planctomycetes bacterium]|nr:glycosyltransferase family 2 protein [Planctomycetota bacterium]
MNVSVLIPAKNEAANLTDCLRSVCWADEVVVVDSRSTDDTRTIAEQAGARVVDFAYQPGGPRKKNWALQALDLRNPWVLLLDADERVTPELRNEIQALPDDPGVDGYYLNRRLIFLGRWIRHAGWYPSWNLRLLRRGNGQFESLGTENVLDHSDVEIHEHIVVRSGKVAYLRSDLIHDDFRDLYHFIEKHNRYSTWESRVYQNLADGEAISGLGGRLLGGPVERKRAIKKLWVRLPCRPLLRFLYMYILRGGFLDGVPGYIFCRLMSQHEFHIWAKAWEQTAGVQRPVASSSTVPVRAETECAA